MRTVAKKDVAELNLEELIPLYGKTKKQADDYKKTADVQNKSIKEKMAKLLKKDTNTVDKTVGGWTATYQLRISEKWNEEALVEFLENHAEFEGCVETKKVVNAKKLEELLYAGKVPKKLVLAIDKFRTKDKTAYLYIKKEGK